MCTNSDAEGQKFDRSVLLRFHTKYYNKRRPVSEFRHVRLLHDNMIMPHHLHVHLSSISSIERSYNTLFMLNNPRYRFEKKNKHPKK